VPKQIAEKSIHHRGQDGHVVESWPAPLGVKELREWWGRYAVRTAGNGGSELFDLRPAKAHHSHNLSLSQPCSLAGSR
jgi:hypothetical protein